MNDRTFERVAEIIEAAHDLQGAERERYVVSACVGDEELLREVWSLLPHAEGEAPTLAQHVEGLPHRDALRELLPEAQDGSPAGASLEPAPESIGHFAIVRRLATGGMGTVYEAEQLDPARRVALKTMRTELFTPTLLKRFRRESQILGRLQHPGIAQVFEAGTVEHQGGTLPYFAMEFIDGKPLGAYAADEGLDERQRLTLFVQVCDAVHHAHSQGVVHRDLKPDNILVTAEGHPKVLDFGIARVTGSDVQAPTLVTEVGQVMGTLPYMSPEQVAGNPDDIDARSDVYALGVVLFELLAGRRPHELGDKSLPDAARVIRDVEATRLGTVATRWRGDVETIVGKALEKDPARRYAGAEALAADVRRHLADQPINAHAPSRLYRLRKFTQRHTGLVVGTTLAVVALAVGLAFSVNFALDEARQRRAGEVTSYRALITAATASLDNGEQLAARGILDQTDEALRGWEWHHASARAEPLLWSVERNIERNEVAGWEAPGWGENGVLPTVFSPDDTLLAAPLAVDRVGVFDSKTGVRRFELALTGRLEKRTLVATARGFLTVTREGHVVHWDGATGEVLAEDHVPGPINTVVWDETHGRLAAAAVASDGGEDRLLVGPLGAIEEIDHALFLGAGLGSHEPIGWCRDGRTLVGYRSALLDLPLREGAGAPTPSLRSALGADCVYACQGDRLLVLPSRRGGGNLALTDLGGDVLVDLEPQSYSYIASTSLSRDQRRIAVTSGRSTRRTVSVHDAATGLAIASWPGPAGTRGDLSGQGHRLALGTLDRLRVISLDSAAVSVLPGATEYVYDLAWTPDGRTLLARNFRYSARAYDVAEETVVFDVLSPGMREGRLHAMTTRTWGLSSDGMRLVESYHPGKSPAMKMATHDLVAGGPWQGVAGVGWEDAGAEAVEATIDMPRASRVEFLRVTGAIGPSTADPAALALTRARSSAPRVLVDPSGTRLVAALALAIEAVDGSPSDRVPLTWSSQVELPFESGMQHTDAHFSPDGRLLAATRPTVHEGVVVHDTTSGAPVVELLADLETEPDFYAVAFSPDGTRLAVGGTDRVVSLFDTSDWALVTQLEGHRGYVKDIAWSPDGRTLATCGGDGTVRLWHTRTLAERTAAAHVAARRREEQRPAVEALFAQLDDPHAVASAVRADPSLDDDDRHAALRCVRELADAWWAAREDGGGEPTDR